MEKVLPQKRLNLQLNKKNLLIIHQGALGDFITTFPALHLLRRQYRLIDAVCQKKLGTLAGYLGIIDSHFPLESAAAASVYSGTVHPELRRLIESYQTIIIFSFSETLKKSISRLSKQNIYRIDPRPDPEKKVHVTAHVLDGLEAAGIISNTRYPDVGGRQNMAYDRRDHQYDASGVILHPGSGSFRKNWPLSNFIRLAEMLKAEGKQPMFICGPAEQEMIPTLSGSGYPVRQMDDLIELSKSLQRSGGFIGNDSGVSHLSAYLGVSTVVVFGPSDPDRWRPIGRCVSVVQADSDCRPCFETDKDRCESRDCLSGISPDRVLAAYFQLSDNGW